jgi:hypothetical protein
MTATRKTISHIEAIDIVGKSIFGSDWIGKLTKEDHALIAKHGPRAGKRGGTTIDPCPTKLTSQLDRALGKAQRISPQRGAAADWLLDHGLVHADGCDLTAVASALAKRPISEGSPGPNQGRPAKFEAIAILMQTDIAAGTQTLQSLRKAYGKNLQEWYGADPKTCKRARDLALSSFS